MLKQLTDIEERYEELCGLLSNPKVISNQDAFQKYAREHASLSEIVEAYGKIKKTAEEITENKEILNGKDEELKELAKEELALLEKENILLKETLRSLLLPKDPNDEKNVLLEIRAGAGGDEAALFAGELYRMYSRYAEKQRWKLDVMSISETGSHGIKEIIVLIQGKGAYSKLKYESGVHRVQRVPETEASGRIHTSTATVAMLPEAEEVDVEIQDDDLRIDTFRAGGHGGQNVNKVESAIRITHNPTGLVVNCQDEKSQYKNKQKALKILRSRLLDMRQQEQHSKIAEDRKTQIGTGDRSEKIRTYNFPQNRVSDHRIGITIHKLGEIMDGNIDEMINRLITNFQAEALKGSVEEATLN